MIDFSDCQHDIFRVYGGANGSKIGVEYDGHMYLLKFPPRSHPKYQTEGYANSCISEHLGCRIFESVGMRSQETMLGTYRLDDGKVKTVVACRDFTEGGKKFSPFLDVKNSCLSSDESGAGTELRNIMSAIDEQKWMDPVAIHRFFWDMFVVDALIGNFDRHNGNWGFLVDGNRDVDVAPVFDCGSSLYPQLPVDQYRRVLDDRREIDLRLYVRPESCTVAISHGDCAEDADYLAELIRAKGANDIIIEYHDICTGSHVGPGMVGLFFWGEDRRKESAARAMSLAAQPAPQKL